MTTFMIVTIGLLSLVCWDNIYWVLRKHFPDEHWLGHAVWAALVPLCCAGAGLIGWYFQYAVTQ